MRLDILEYSWRTTLSCYYSITEVIPIPMTSCEHLPRHIEGGFLRTWCAQWGRIGIADPVERRSTSILLGMISSVGNKGLPPQINASAYWANCWSPVPLSLESPGLSMVLTHYHGCASTVVVTIWPFKHSGGGDNPKPGVGDTRPSWWWHQGSSPITQLLLTTSGPCKQFSTRLRLRYWSSVSPRGTTNTPSVRKSGSKLGSIGKVEGVDWLSWMVEVVEGGGGWWIDGLT